MCFHHIFFIMCHTICKFSSRDMEILNIIFAHLYNFFPDLGTLFRVILSIKQIHLNFNLGIPFVFCVVSSQSFVANVSSTIHYTHTTYNTHRFQSKVWKHNTFSMGFFFLPKASGERLITYCFTIYSGLILTHFRLFTTVNMVWVSAIFSFVVSLSIHT